MIIIIAIAADHATAAGNAPNAANSDTQAHAATSPAATSPAALIAEARRDAYPQSAVLLLRAARGALDSTALDEAATAAAALRKLPLNGADEYATSLIEIEIDLLAKRTHKALDRLAKLPLAPSPALRRDSGGLRAQSLEADNQFALAARERATLMQFVTGSARKDNAAMLWRDLGNLPVAELTTLDRAAEPGAYGAWVALASSYYSAHSVEERRQRFLAWSEHWKNLVAMEDLPIDLRVASTAPRPGQSQFAVHPGFGTGALADRDASADSTRTIAMLLPMSGQLAIPGRAVRDGFVAAMMSSNAPHPRLLVFDTVLHGADGAYREAVAARVDVVVGPLDKQELVRINAMGELPVTALALNYLPEGTKPAANLYQFGLAPEDDARDVAEHVYADNHRNVLLMAMSADWAVRAAAAFTARWTQLGGRITDHVTLGGQGEIERQVQAALLANESQARFKAVSQAIGFAPQFTERHRQDVEAIILFIRPAVAQAVSPTLKFYFANDLPVYASSHIFGDQSASAAAELEGVRFCDTPWQLQGDPLRTQLRASLPKSSGELSNLNALGVDAFNLQSQLPQLATSNARVKGATGVLSLGEGARIVRGLSWGVFANGGVHAIATSAR